MPSVTRVLWAQLPDAVKASLEARGAGKVGETAIVDYAPPGAEAHERWYFRRTAQGWNNTGVDRNASDPTALASDLTPEQQAVARKQVDDLLAKQKARAEERKAQSDAVAVPVPTLTREPCPADLLGLHDRATSGVCMACGAHVPARAANAELARRRPRIMRFPLARVRATRQGEPVYNIHGTCIGIAVNGSTHEGWVEVDIDSHQFSAPVQPPNATRQPLLDLRSLADRYLKPLEDRFEEREMLRRALDEKRRLGGG